MAADSEPPTHAGNADDADDVDEVDLEVLAKTLAVTLEECLERIKALLDRHQNWWIVRFDRHINHHVDKLARRPFDEWAKKDENGRATDTRWNGMAAKGGESGETA